MWRDVVLSTRYKFFPDLIFCGDWSSHGKRILIMKLAASSVPIRSLWNISIILNYSTVLRLLRVLALFAERKTDWALAIFVCVFVPVGKNKNAQNSKSAVARYSRRACRSHWPRDLRHEMSSLPQTLWAWVRIPLEAWVSVCVFSVYVFCVGSGHATRLITRARCPTNCQ
jgi:hypothetical protein